MTDVRGGETEPAYPVRAEPVGTAEFAWRLSASNGRAMARSAATFPAAMTALDAFEAAVTLAATRALPGTVGHRPEGGWGWTVFDGHGRALAHSPRTFERHGSCARSLRRFREALATLASTQER